MPPKIAPWTQGYVFCLSEEGYTYSQIIRRCKEKNISISKFAISNIIKKHRNNNGHFIEPAEKKERNYPKKLRNTTTIRKVAQMVDKENPATHKHIANVSRKGRQTLENSMRIFWPEINGNLW